MNRVIVLTIIGFLTLQLNAQIIVEQEGKMVPLESMILQVKQLDEFLNRFNYKQDFYGKKVTESFKNQFPREKYIGLLFNNQDFRFLEGNSEFSPDYVHLKNEFISQITKDEGLYINKLSEKIFAVAECKLIYKGKQAKATLVLNMENVSNYVKWVIRKVDAGFLEIKNTDGVKNSIPPNDNETNFISLKRSLDKKTNLNDLTDKQFDYNQLSTFLYLVSVGDIKFLNVEKLKYLILDIDNWVISVSYFNRDTENSGWLISNISRQDEELKEYFGL